MARSGNLRDDINERENDIIDCEELYCARYL
jgi:hypothetical protein